MADPFIGVVKQGIGSFSEAISLAEDLDGVAKQISALGQEEVAARKAWRHKQAQVKGDYAFVNAVDEYRRVKEALDLKEQIRLEVTKQWGPKAWDEVLSIEKRQKEDHKKLYTEDGLDKEKLFKVKLACFGLAGIIVLILYMMGIIRQMSEAFYP